MKEILFLIVLFACMNIFGGCVTGRDLPEDEMTEWKLLRIEKWVRDSKPVDVQIWQVKGVERQIVGSTDYPIGIILWWPVQK